MAEAAGIAEGTIFRVFPDKASVIAGAIKASMDPAPVQDALAHVPEDIPMEAQLEKAARVLLDWSGRVGTLFGVLRTVHPPTTGRPSGGRRIFRESNAAILAAQILGIKHPEIQQRLIDYRENVRQAVEQDSV